MEVKAMCLRTWRSNVDTETPQIFAACLLLTVGCTLGGSDLMQPWGPGYYAQQAVWACPFCRWQGAPVEKSKVSSGGWITFWILGLLTCMIFCWVGLLIRENFRLCGNCGSKVG